MSNSFIEGVVRIFLAHYIDATVKKVKAHCANALTLLNLSLGVFSILAIVNGETQLGLLLIFIAAFADRFDGMIARKLKIESDFGKQLDSMCDIVSFGVAPALLIYELTLREFGAAGILFTTIYIACGAIRLAKFNIVESNGYFTGLPITAAGVALTLFTLGNEVFAPFVFMFITIILSFLMVSPFKLKKM